MDNVDNLKRDRQLLFEEVIRLREENKVLNDEVTHQINDIEEIKYIADRNERFIRILDIAICGEDEVGKVSTLDGLVFPAQQLRTEMAFMKQREKSMKDNLYRCVGFLKQICSDWEFDKKGDLFTYNAAIKLVDELLEYLKYI